MIEFINNIYELSSRIRTSNWIHARKKLYAGCKRRPNSLKRDLRETVSICVKTGVIHRATLSCTSDAQDNNSFFFINFARSPAKERRKFDLFSTLIIFISHNYEKETRSLLGSNILFFFFFLPSMNFHTKFFSFEKRIIIILFFNESKTILFSPSLPPFV